MKIICDTNIWYDIANKTIPKSQLEGKELVLTGLTIDEIISSENLYKNPELIKSVIKSIRLNHSDVIYDDPFEFRYHENSKNQKLDLKYRVDRYKMMLHMEEGLNLNHLTYEQYMESVANFNDRYTGAAEGMNKKMFLLHNQKDKYGSKKVRKFDFKFIAYEVLKTIMQNRFFNRRNIPSNLLPKGELEFYLSGWDEYLKEITLLKNSKVTTNDIFDLLQLLYVTPKVKFWTKEKKWNRLLLRTQIGQKLILITKQS